MNDTSLFTNVAWIFVAAMTLVGLGLLFVQATNIERPNLVAAGTLAFCAIAAIVLLKGSAASGAGLMWGAIALSLFGFISFRVIDAIMGPRAKLHHDNATLDAELSD